MKTWTISVLSTCAKTGSPIANKGNILSEEKAFREAMQLLVYDLILQRRPEFPNGCNLKLSMQPAVESETAPEFIELYDGPFCLKDSSIPDTCAATEHIRQFLKGRGIELILPAL